MREISEYPIDYLEVIEMFWGMSAFNIKKVKAVDPEFVENIPVPTATRINALVQTKLSLISSEERKEWADRVEGKAVSREVSMSLITDDDNTSTSATRELIMSRFDELSHVWSEYVNQGQTTKELPTKDEPLKLEHNENVEDNG